MPTSLYLCTMVLALPPQVAPAQSPPTSPSGREAQLTHCLVSLIEDVQVPAREAGALTSVAVVEGQYVTQGQLLAQIDDAQPRLDKLAAELERDAALAKAQDDIGGRYARGALSWR